MKKSELKYIIKEALEATTMEMVEPIDEIGTFMIVKKPKKGMAMEDMMQEVSIYDSIMKEEIIMATTNKSAARKRAKEALKEYEMQKNTLKKEMEEYRAAKKAIEEKKTKAKELINKLR
jgi:hypothetical protein